MKISLIIPSFYPAVVYGGPIFSTLHTSKALAELDGVEVYTSTTNANMDSYLDVDTHKWIAFDNNFYVKYYHDTKLNKLSLSLLFNLWKDIKQSDVVHIQSVFSSSTLIALVYAKLFKKPMLLSPRGQFGGWCLEHGSLGKRHWLNYLVKPFARSLTWHATAQQEKEEIKAIFPNANVEVIPNGIDFESFQNFSKISREEFVLRYAGVKLKVSEIIVSMGRLQQKKGFDILIDSFHKALDVRPDIKLLIAGHNEGEENNLKRQIIRLGLQDTVFLIGAISGQDKIDFLANADLFVLPSHNENFGNVYLESLAVGTPIIASTNTPWSEVEVEGCGRWVPNTVDDTSNAILELLNKGKKSMRDNTIKYAQKYDWKNVALQFRELFSKW